MSIDFNAYCKNSAPIDIAELAAVTVLAGWNIIVFRGHPNGVCLKGGALKSGDLILGWDVSGSSPDAMCEKCAKESVETLLENDTLAYSELWIVSDFEGKASFSEDYGEKEMLEYRGEEYLQHFLSAKIHYEINTKATCSESSSVLQRATGEAIARLRNGLLDNPQSGEFQVCGERAE